MHKSLITFYGGTGSVTGANFLFEDGTSGKKALTDCGMFQGKKVGDDKNREPFLYNPNEVDVLFVTHAHIDHIGRIPLLVKNGFKGKIYSTPATKEISELMLKDSIGILSKEAAHDNLPPLYLDEDVDSAMALWETVPYHTRKDLFGGITFEFSDAGHILGSAMVILRREGRQLVFTGDLGNSPSPLLRDTENIPESHYIVMESVYGDRLHESREARKEMLRKVVVETVAKGGALVIPAFSLERTQELLFEFNSLVESKIIPAIPVFLDSPLAIKVTHVYKKYVSLLNETAKEYLRDGDDIYHFPNLRMSLETEDSKKIKEIPNPKIIIAGSGMSNGGRIVHHEKEYLPDPKSTILLMGYQAIGTLGRLIEEGVNPLRIHGEYITVRARVKKIGGYSGHKDSDQLLEFAATAGESAEKYFLVMGEPRASLFLAQRIRDYLGKEAIVPKEGDTAHLDF